MRSERGGGVGSEVSREEELCGYLKEMDWGEEEGTHVTKSCAAQVLLFPKAAVLVIGVLKDCCMSFVVV